MDEGARSVLAFIEAQHVVSLALCDGGLPHACSLMYAHAGVTLYWLSDPATRHSRIIDAGGAVAAAATIAPDYTDFADIRGLQITGTASRAPDAAPALAALARRYSFLRTTAASPKALLAALAKGRAYRLVPDTITFIDNTRSFGGKTVWRPGDFGRD